MAEWRELTNLEKECIQTLLRESDWNNCWNIDDLAGCVLDESGSLALSTRPWPATPNLVASPIVSGYFSDGDQEGYPVGEILLYERDGALTELSIYRGDGLPLKQKVDPTTITMISQQRKPTVI